MIEIDAASNTGVDNIRELIERSRFAPVQARWKVYVVDECHMLSTAAFNALLKTLEEPPPRVVFVLATTDPQRVLPTILSRCQRFDFRRIPLEALERHLQWIAAEETIGITPEALHLVAQRSQGGLRDAESLLDQLSLLPAPIAADAVWDLLGAVPEQELLQLAEGMASGDPLQVVEGCRELLDRGREPSAVLQGLASLLRDLLLAGVAPDRLELTSVSPELRPRLPEVARRIGKARLLHWQAQLKGSEQQLRHSVQPRLWLEVLVLGLLAEPTGGGPAASGPGQSGVEVQRGHQKGSAGGSDPTGGLSPISPGGAPAGPQAPCHGGRSLGPNVPGDPGGRPGSREPGGALAADPGRAGTPLHPHASLPAGPAGAPRRAAGAGTGGRHLDGHGAEPAAPAGESGGQCAGKSTTAVPGGRGGQSGSANASPGHGRAGAGPAQRHASTGISATVSASANPAAPRTHDRFAG